MRVAVFSDVHGNLTALDAVLAHARDERVEQHWVVGDLVAHGPHPAETLHRIRALPGLVCVRGNTDRYVTTGDLRGIQPPIDNASTPAEVEVLVNASCSFAWTRGAITAAGGYDWLAARPLEHRSTLPEGTRVLLVHAAPGRDDGPGLHPDQSDDQLRLAGVSSASGADLLFTGHTHVPLDRVVDGVRAVNVGSVSLPATSERRAMWTLLVADEDGYTIEPRFSAYDVSAVVTALADQHHPSADWLTVKLQRPPA